MRKHINPSVVTALALVAVMSFFAWYLDTDTIALTGRYLQTGGGVHVLIDENGSPVQLIDRSETGIFSGLNSGDLVLVSCTPPSETYPAQAVAYLCMLQEEGSPADLPADTLAMLTELKWLTP